MNNEEMNEERGNNRDELFSLRSMSCFDLGDCGESKEIFNLEHEFFKGFEMPLQDEGDPYYNIEMDMRKKDIDFDSNSFMFFE